MHILSVSSDSEVSDVARLVERARTAQAIFERFPQDQVDGIVKGIGRYVFENAELLSRLAVDETRMGRYEDKIVKKRGKSRAIWNSLKGKKSRGVIGEDASKALIYVAKPLGVVGAVTPATNPVVTPMCNAMFALKCGNAIIFASHPRAKRCADHLTKAFMRVVKDHGGPDHLIQALGRSTVDATQELMRSVDAVVATGGNSMVRAAYSSGKPSFGVGPGNVPVIIDRGVDLKETSAKIVEGASFDNGIICSREQFVLTPVERYRDTVQAFLDTNKVWYTEDEAVVERFRQVVFPGGTLAKEVVGRPPEELAKRAGVDIPAGTRLLLLRARGAGIQDLLAKEKLCPVVGILPYDTFEDALHKAKANLLLEGAGHSAAIHSDDEAHIRAAGVALPVSRLIVNQPSSITAGGALNNGFTPTTTLGCGSWGGNSISENLDFKHLMNVSQIGRVISHAEIPSDAQIWA